MRLHWLAFCSPLRAREALPCGQGFTFSKIPDHREGPGGGDNGLPSEEYDFPIKSKAYKYVNNKTHEDPYDSPLDNSRPRDYHSFLHTVLGMTTAWIAGGRIPLETERNRNGG
jgi:hypothetical protein